MRTDLDEVSSIIEISLSKFFESNYMLSKSQYEQIIEDAFREVFGDEFIKTWKENREKRKKHNAKVISEPQGSIKQ